MPVPSQGISLSFTMVFLEAVVILFLVEPLEVAVALFLTLFL